VVAYALGEGARPDHGQVGKYVPATRPKPVALRDESINVVKLREVATRLGIRGAEVERMITGLPTGYTLTVPISGVDARRSPKR
jgi:hypothetical protein